MRSIRGFVAAATTAGLFGLLIAPSASAAQGATGTEKGSWTLRGFAARLDTDEFRFESGPPVDPFPFAPAVDFTFTLGDGSGAGVALESRATRRLGVEALAIRADLEGELRFSITNPQIPEQVVREDVETDLYGLGLNVHLTPGRRFDVYVGPLVAYVDYGDFNGSFDVELGAGNFMGTFEARFDDDTAYGATLGADVPLGRSGAWAASAAVRKLWYDAEDDGDGMELALDPLIATAGVAYRFGR